MQLEISDLSHDGRGVGRLDGQVYFVEGALPGEIVGIKNIVQKKRFSEAEVSTVLQVSPERIDPPCPWYPECGGCDLQHYSYEAGLRWKKKRVERLLQKAGCAVRDTWITGMKNPWQYRNHMQLQVRDQTIGFFRRGSHAIVPVESCMIQSETANRVLAAIRKYTLPVRVRRIFVRTEGNQAMIGFEGPVPAGDLSKLFSAGVISVWQKQKNWVHVDGEPSFQMKLKAHNFSVRPDTFFQINTDMAEKIFSAAVRMMGCNPDESYLDLYCGIGPLGMIAAQQARHITGVEISMESVAMAEETARREKIENIRFLCAPSEAAAENVLRSERLAGVFVDPPRAGLDRSLIDLLTRSAVRRIVYISCDPATLARDAGRFLASGWKVNGAETFDLFPWTAHIETVLSIEREDSRAEPQVFGETV